MYCHRKKKNLLPYIYGCLCTFHMVLLCSFVLRAQVKQVQSEIKKASFMVTYRKVLIYAVIYAHMILCF
jgi:hypothetical protein